MRVKTESWAAYLSRRCSEPSDMAFSSSSIRDRIAALVRSLPVTRRLTRPFPARTLTSTLWAVNVQSCIRRADISLARSPAPRASIMMALSLGEASRSIRLIRRMVERRLRAGRGDGISLMNLAVPTFWVIPASMAHPMKRLMDARARFTVAVLFPLVIRRSR